MWAVVVPCASNPVKIGRKPAESRPNSVEKAVKNRTRRPHDVVSRSEPPQFLGKHAVHQRRDRTRLRERSGEGVRLRIPDEEVYGSIDGCGRRDVALLETDRRILMAVKIAGDIVVGTVLAGEHVAGVGGGEAADGTAPGRAR